MVNGSCNRVLRLMWLSGSVAYLTAALNKMAQALLVRGGSWEQRVNCRKFRGRWCCSSNLE